MNYFNILSAVTSAAPDAAPELFFEPLNFVQNLRHMGVGMVVIFLIIGVIILSTMLINYLFSDSSEK